MRERVLSQPWRRWLLEESRHNKRGSTTWLAAVEAIGTPTRLRLDTPLALASGLQVAALLGVAPLLEAADLTADAGTGVVEHPKLARMWALLAKAESTEFDEEAEALCAKAQELISHYALGRLLDQSHQGLGRNDANAPQVRRIWLDPPYVCAKAALVLDQRSGHRFTGRHLAVADANLCQTALTEKLSFCVVVGADLDAVELLVTPLLRTGRRYDARGVERTRSLGQAFLLAYATGIGTRLRAAADVAAHEMVQGSAGRPDAV